MIQPAQLDHDYSQFSSHFNKFRSHFTHCTLAKDVVKTGDFKRTHLEIGAGTGHFFASLAQLFPEDLFIAIERDRMRGKALARKSKKLALPNFQGIRGNAMPAVFHGLQAESVDSIFILYPCPWPKFSQRKNRWYFHAIMPDLVKILKPGGTLVWASDQEFYIREAEYVCTTKYPLKLVGCGPVEANRYNYFDRFPEGRTKFEKTFLAEGHQPHELILTK